MKDMLPILLVGVIGYLLYQQMQTQHNPSAGYLPCSQAPPLTSCIGPDGRVVIS